jgi:hypothetical protein
MQDEEYPAYLKQQSYDDLVSISLSIDKESQARRHEMILAEIAERKKRGESSKKKETKIDGIATLLLGCFFIFEFVGDLTFLRTGWKPIIHLTLGIVCLITYYSLGWSQKKKK